MLELNALRTYVSLIDLVGAMGRILTADNLRKWAFHLTNMCCLCKQNKGTINHLLIHCEYTADLWHLALNTFGVSWVMPSNILELLHCWIFQGWGHSKGAI